jgi:hypothetical protein
MAKKRGPEEVPLRRSCGAMAVHMMLLEKYPAFRARQFRLEQDFTKRRAAGVDLAKLSTVTLDVVVNVLFKADEQNISDAQVKSQIAVLNRDYAAKNSDKTKVPTPWQGLVTDSKIRFKLSKITRQKTSVSSFDADDTMKKPAHGVVPFKPQQSLNIWVCALGGGLLGYAQFPGGPPATDGVVINYLAFGTTGTAKAPFKLGRTATHEVGHYLNLRHIWGDTEDCSGSDMIADTPNCASPNFGKPKFPIVTCNNGPNGDMFVNYMDYVDDDSMMMFTSQQVIRMRTALESERSGLI